MDQPDTNTNASIATDNNQATPANSKISMPNTLTAKPNTPAAMGMKITGATQTIRLQVVKKGFNPNATAGAGTTPKLNIVNNNATFRNCNRGKIP